jgi:cytochrome c nitrite reductase small subunit
LTVLSHALVLLLAIVTAPGPAQASPHGWIGTTDDWARGLGIAFVALAVGVLAVAWRRLGQAGLTPGLKQLLVLPLVVLPPAIVFFGYSFGIERSKSVASCGSCHVMEPYLADLRNAESETLAATHYKNRYIQDNHCYTCHTDYGMFGTVQAKLAGMGHVARNVTGRYTLPLKIAHPYPNSRCLACHGESQKFLKSEGHPKEDLPGLLSGATSCIDCHGPAHPTAETAASR